MDDIIEVLVTVGFNSEQIKQIEKASPRLHVNQIITRDTTDIPEDIWGKTKILYTSDVLPSPEQASNLRWVQFHWAGIDSMIDAPILHKPGLMATTLSGAAASQAAEYVIMMLLALGHHLPQAMALQNRTEWPEDRWKRFRPLELRHSTVGIVGYGSIGRQIAKLLIPFGANVLAAKHDAMHIEDTGYMPENMGDPNADLVKRIYPGMAIKSMLKECDFIVICTPKTPETINLISENEFAVCKPTAFLIDISRGGIVDHAALISAIKDQNLAGAALDVFPAEPLLPDNPLWEMPEIIITPHIAGTTSRYNEQALEVFITNLERYLTGEPLLNHINLARGY
ncbi:MAG: D-2-hydroxyacid dehydrogenase [Anaerolineales bacterium]|nr:D-2-hydroxyacid dehydrogenase [Anaerolineales bacterium]